MALESGTRLGPYQIRSLLGAGGMGEVYRAHDPRLERDVAVKVLRANVSSDLSLRQRLEREAKSVSKLTHPHICTLYDIGHQDGVDFLVMELLEGETLDRRLLKGPLPLEQTIAISTQIAQALAKAHRLGIVHRDLKPGNVMLTKTGAKLMDFGLAKACSPAPLAAALTESTLDQDMETEKGSIVGTFQYMAPEQLKGNEADPRTDIFALGEVMYEMVTGKRAFNGETRAGLIASILTAEPLLITPVQSSTPLALAWLVKKCLAKDPDERWQSASDLASALNWIIDGIRPSSTAQLTASGRISKPLAALPLLLLLAVGAVLWFRPRQPVPAMRFSVPVPFPANDVALSPDGRTLALVAYSEQANQYVIWAQQVGTGQVRTVSGTEGASHPFWSPDSRSIGFFANGKLKKVDVLGGSVQVLCDAPNGRGGAWNSEGTIVFSPDGNAGLYRVLSTGGTPIEVTKPDVSRLETSNRWPAFLPDGRHFLFLGANFSGAFEKNAVFVASLDSNERRFIVNASSNAVYADPGYLLYMRGNAVVAQRFDSHTYMLSGGPRTVVDEVRYVPAIDLALFSVTANRVLVAQTGMGSTKSQLTWFDRRGKSVGTVGPPGIFSNPALSPDERRVVVDQYAEDGRIRDLWIYGLASNTAVRFTFGPSYNDAGIWSPDGKRIVFSSNRKLYNGLYQKNSDGTGDEELLVDLGGVDQNAWDWSRDGKYLLARVRSAAQLRSEVWYMSLPDRKVKPYLQSTWTMRNARFSPDGKWVAYASNETGNSEVYVSPFPSPNSKWQVSRGGGEQPRWRRDGKELFYLSEEGKMMAVEVKTASNLEAGTPVALFQTRLSQPIATQDVFSYDVTANGQRFLVNTKVGEPSSAPLVIILNWAADMDK